ncbi:MAG: MFS transporter [Xanthobacteraceae bacterium]|nr:MFS transporter [Xanthobacteraceae bacterium]
MTSPRPQNLLFAPVLASISLIGPMVIHLYFPVIPVAKVALRLTDAEAQLTFSVAMFCMAFATLAYGALSDRYGRRPLLLSGLSIFLFGSVIAYSAETVTTMVIGRALQAIGAACGVTLVRAIASDVYGPGRLVKAIAYLTMFYTLGPMISPLVGGLLIDTLGWRSVFLFALLVGGLILVGAYLAIPETRAADKPPATNLLRGYGELLGQLRFAAFVLQPGFQTGTFLTIATASSGFMKELLNRPSFEFGLYFLLFPIGFLCGNFISTRLSGRVVNETMVLAGGVLSAITVAVQSAFLLSGHISPWVLFVPGFFVTMAQGISLPFGQAAAMTTNPRLVGMAAGLGVFMQNLGGAIFSQLYGLLANGTVRPLVMTTAITAVLSLISGAIPFVMMRKDLRSGAPP